MRSITKTSDASHAMVRIIPSHQDAIVSKKLKPLNISSLKDEQEKAVVGVLNTDA